MSRVLFAVTSHFKDASGWESGCYVLEVAVPYFYLVKNGVEIDFVSPKGGAVPAKQCDLDAAKVKSFFADKMASEKFYSSKVPEEIDSNDYDAIYFPGGHGVVFDLPNCEKIAKIAGEIYDKDGVVCAVCHGGAGLLNVKLADGSFLIDGKNLTAFSNKEEEAIGTEQKVPFLLETALVEKGANYSCAANWQQYVVVDGRLITGQNPASDLEMAKELVKLLKEKID
ncbi:type 1 glutamine amidotransferase domain-containing protein [Labilibaculum euxinus]|uniref:Type 1 glutamine amidotransferase domain-containing protein n=1 Tax=Labilibaculum euxinus TaxID=2686357 RepID=A0A7M4D924_9BACT|nr:type 1 glutamine amidotransferase domain-containing protein [Labilibaculum euxinus]MUP39153.1 type 1 glutamine amidotransferase domain-containing protein [Labilibaculum euxinus]MVB08358.1 type 1 glutamine amidotransferase domain-containing protein [Labilibaculum euxinus]